MTTSVVIFTSGMVTVASVGDVADSVTFAKFPDEGVRSHSSSKVRESMFAFSPFR